MNGCHYWDDFMNKNFQRFAKNIPQTNEEEMVEDIRKYFNNTKYISPIERLLTQNPYDQNISYRPRLLFAQVWNLVRNDKDKIEILIAQIDDLVTTSGYCEQGWSNRLFQVLFALDLIN